MAVLKVYTKEHHESIAASRRDMREATNRIRGSVPVGGKSTRRVGKVAKAAVEPESIEVPEEEVTE